MQLSIQQKVKTEHTEGTPALECPRCNSKIVARTPRGRYVKTLLPWLPVKHYKCIKCDNKFYKLN